MLPRFGAPCQNPWAPIAPSTAHVFQPCCREGERMLLPTSLSYRLTPFVLRIHPYEVPSRNLLLECPQSSTPPAPVGHGAQPHGKADPSPKARQPPKPSATCFSHVSPPPACANRPPLASAPKPNDASSSEVMHGEHLPLVVQPVNPVLGAFHPPHIALQLVESGFQRIKP